MPTSAVDHIASRVVEATFAAPLIPRLRLSPCSALAAPAAINLPPVIGLAEHDDLRASGAANPHENLDLHARTSRPHSWNLPRPSALGHLRPVSVHARHEGSGSYSWAFINFAVEEIATRPGRTPPLLDRTPRRSVSSGSRRSLTGGYAGASRPRWNERVQASGEASQTVRASPSRAVRASLARISLAARMLLSRSLHASTAARGTISTAVDSASRTRSFTTRLAGGNRFPRPSRSGRRRRLASCAAARRAHRARHWRRP